MKQRAGRGIAGESQDIARIRPVAKSGEIDLGNVAVLGFLVLMLLSVLLMHPGTIKAAFKARSARAAPHAALTAEEEVEGLRRDLQPQTMCQGEAEGEDREALPESGIVGQINEKVRPLVDLIDGLRSVGIEKDVPIPQIAVMGDQSSGKSSVLEALSGVCFPRGAGLVTRCATELRMKRSRSSEDSAWRATVKLSWDREQPSCAGEVKTPEEIGEKIVNLTEILLNAGGFKKTFESEHSIVVELQSPDAPDLTVIDLPGIVRTAVSGQNESVIQDVDSLLERYLKQDRTIILAVIPSNVDIATVDIIERASRADPEGKRTIAVLTKPDMIGEGAHQPVLETLQNLSKPLKLGYIMTKNRSQRELNEGLSLSDAKASEMRFFSSHEAFGPLLQNSPELFGVSRLTVRLTEIMFNHIEQSLPDIKRDVVAQIKRVRADLDALGSSIPEGLEAKRDLFLQIAMAINRDLEDAIAGKYSSPVFSRHPSSRIVSRLRSNVGAVHDFNEYIYKHRPVWDIEDVKASVAQLRGREVPGFVNFEVFRCFVREYVEDWKDPLMSLLEKTALVLQEAGHGIVHHHAEGAPRLAAMLSQVIADIVEESAEKTRLADLQVLLENEREPFTMNHYFMDTVNKMKLDGFDAALSSARHLPPHQTLIQEPKMKEWAKGALCLGESNVQQEAQSLIHMLEAYWKTSSKRFIDNGCQNIDRAVVRPICKLFMRRCLKLAEDREALGEILKEDMEISSKRRNLQDKLMRLKEAHCRLFA